MASTLLARGKTVSGVPYAKDVAGQVHTQRAGHDRSHESARASILDIRFLSFRLSKRFSSSSQNTTPPHTRLFRRTRSAYLGTNSIIVIPTSHAAIVPLRAVRADGDARNDKAASLVPDNSGQPVFAIKAAKYGASVVRSPGIETPALATKRPRRPRPLCGYFYRVDEDEEELEDQPPEVREALYVNASITAMGYHYEPLDAGQAVWQ
ncbi:hypothetical protein B0H19DRAFT_1268305 [Mycena capillaripes]|nr:hypothetical protein B0H19DRAFT_1268305 [Mycena capillaripes]